MLTEPDLGYLADAGLRLEGNLIMDADERVVAKVQGVGDETRTVVIDGSRTWLPFSRIGDGCETRSAVRRFCEARARVP